MLRAIRFAMQLGFKIDAKTWSSIKKYIKRVNDSVSVNGRSERKVPYEVIAAEFLKSFSFAPAETIRMYDRAGALRVLMPEIFAMKKCGQPKEFHSEGNVLKHTLLALKNLDSKLFRRYFGGPVALTTKVAILLHDVGKPAAKKKIGGRVVFYNHDRMGADIAKKFLERMKLSAPPEIGIYADEVVWLVENHLLFFYAPPEAMRKTTLEKYLFHKNFSGRAHLELFLADALATKPLRRPVDLKRFKSAHKLWKSLQEKKTEVPPKPLLDGNEAMKILNIAPGPKVGKVLELLREEQLRGRIKDKKSAAQFLKKIEF
jgi:poly(A) polymerase